MTGVLTRRLLLALPLLPGAARAGDAAGITFDGLYESFGVTGLVFAARLKALAGSPVAITGFLAPPLKAESRFFVLTREPLAICPFCQSDADWPLDIVVVTLRRAASMPPAGARLTVTGRLGLGGWTDPETGFVSQIRITDAQLARA